MRDFWRSSGFHLLDRDGDGNMAVTDDFLRAYFARPELRGVESADQSEIALHQALLEQPRMPVSADRLAELTDAVARENYEVVLKFRDLLVEHRTLEACYLNLFKTERVPVPPLFVDQMVHVILRNILDGCTDPFRLRAAELLFRTQKVSMPEGAVMLADEETVEMQATAEGFGSLVQLLAEAQPAARSVQLDVLDKENDSMYWDRSDRFDTVLDFTFGRPGPDMLCRVLEAWIRHFFDVQVLIHPIQSIQDDRWVWHVGLDAEASAILNELYNGVEVEEARLNRLVSLFRLKFQNPAAMLPSIAGRPVYLGMAMTADSVLRLKPQNLLVNLPLAEAV